MRQSCPRHLRRDLHNRAQNPREFRFHAPHSQNVAGASRRSAAPGSQVVGVAGYSDISSHLRASGSLPFPSLGMYLLALWLRAPARRGSRLGARRMHGAAGLQPTTCRFAVSHSQAWVASRLVQGSCLSCLRYAPSVKFNSPSTEGSRVKVRHPTGRLQETTVATKEPND